MCEVGRGNWLFTDSTACYATADLRLRQCLCPFATCTPTTNGYGCRVTPTVSILVGFLVVVWLLAGAAYLYVTNYIGSLELEARTKRDSLQGMQYYYVKLFGQDRLASPHEVNVDVAATERTGLLSQAGKQE